MNQRIKELALQAGGSHYPEVNSAQMEQFAQLLVQECADRIRKEIEFGDGELSASNAYKLAFMTHAADLIEQHFGLGKTATADTQMRNRSTYWGNNP